MLCLILLLYVVISSHTRIRMSAVTAEQLSKILDAKLEEKLASLNSTVLNLRKSLDEVINHTKFVDAKYDDLLEKIAKNDDERKALWIENKSLKLAVQSLEKRQVAMEKQLRPQFEEINQKNQYDRRD